MILYWSPLSSYSAKVRIAFALKRLMPELRQPPDGSYRSAAYRAMVPLGTVPALVDGDLVLSESDTIIEYLDDRFPSPSLLPGTARERAQARYLSRLHDLHLEPAVRGLFGQVTPATRQAATIETQAASIASRLATLETALHPDGPYAVGAAPTLADCAFPATLTILGALAPVLGLRPDLGARTRRWRAALARDPRIESVMEPYRDEVARWLQSKLGG
ncbi:MAG: glutathione S-transferase family protein [Alphaproteobacteria bacterium]|nr:glutathione S-transferase family protein [Alphaproteobacteria bacterium]